MDDDRQRALLLKVQEMEFVAVELNLYLDTHPCDADAINDYNCAVKELRKYKEKYESEYGPLLNFGFGGFSRKPWQWIESPWPWEL
ncbi:MAG TPA: spore coat protein CotJB [Methylomusa anaerophila]|uniref:CotJB protein n=1 Tax=Methylomusa anaerophila TaxID=1930071 RepID=A0A348AI04_9FIRM|nr:spore coat protein CotJB [Methylomusa anaerophila]BBB90702.1 CotJB protein [Methylomusa anaerophila]HML88695.1 spore coat protein CotJB [Methylomusa anaerophila]